MKSPRELLLADKEAAIAQARAEHRSAEEIASLERELKFARLVPDLPVTVGGRPALVKKIIDQWHIQVDVGGSNLKWVALDSLIIS